MKRIYCFIVALLLIGALTGCVSPGAIAPNTTSAAELVKQLGKPTDKRPNPQGGEIWDYVYGPEGTATWRYNVDKGGVVRSADQLLTRERLYKVVPGETTEAGVIELLGKPGRINRYSHEVAWEWRVKLNANRGHYVVRFGYDGLARGVMVMEDMFIDGGDKGGK